MKNSSVVPRLLRTKQAAEYLSMSPWTIRRLAQDGKLPVIAEQGSCAWRFDRSDLDRYVERNKLTLS